MATGAGACYKSGTMFGSGHGSRAGAVALVCALGSVLFLGCPRPVGECAANRDCESGEICLERNCRVTCNSNAVCLHTEVCRNGICTTDGDAAIVDGDGQDGASNDGSGRDAWLIDASHADTVRPDTASSDATRLDSAQRDTARPDTVQPDTAQPDTAQPDTAQPDAWTPECTEDLDCDDDNECTANTCDIAHGVCTYPPLGDTAACTDDGNPCTRDHCNNQGGCVHDATDGAACPDEGNECTTDHCVGPVCTHTNKARGTACSLGACCSGGVCTRLDSVDNCGGCGIYCEGSYACVNVPGYTSHHTCKCIGYMNCVRGGYGADATCYNDPSAGWICLCQCGAVSECSGQCGGGATCIMTPGNNYCSY
jgi:hypothetical protein